MAAGFKVYDVVYSGVATLKKRFWADDTTTPTTLDDTAIIVDSAGNEILGKTDGAAVITDATGTLQQYLRGLVKQICTVWTYGSGAVTAGTPRFTLASDSPGVIALGNTTQAASMPVTLASNDPLVAAIAAEDSASASADKGIRILAIQQPTPADTADTAGDYAYLQMSGGFLWVAPPPLTKASATFNRPADTTAYGANDAVSDNTTAGSVTKMSFSIARAAGSIRRVKVRKSDQTVATPTIRVWFWDATFTVGAGDNAAFTGPLQDALGFVDVAVTSAGSDDAVGWANCDIPFAAGTVYCLLQTLSAFTPANGETFTVELHYIPGG